MASAGRCLATHGPPGRGYDCEGQGPLSALFARPLPSCLGLDLPGLDLLLPVNSQPDVNITTRLMY